MHANFYKRHEVFPHTLKVVACPPNHTSLGEKKQLPNLRYNSDTRLHVF